MTLKDAHRINFSLVPIEAEMWMVGGEMGHLKQPPPQEISNWGGSIATYDICYPAGSLVIVGEHESNVLRSSNLTVHQDGEVHVRVLFMHPIVPETCFGASKPKNMICTYLCDSLWKWGMFVKP